MGVFYRLLFAWLVLFAAMPSRADSQSFDAHVTRGQELYLLHDYRGAIAELEAAYALRPVNRLLFNLGMAQRKLGHTRLALAFFERYRDGRKARDADVPIDRYIDELRAQLAVEERAPPSTTVGAPPSTTVDATPRTTVGAPPSTTVDTATPSRADEAQSPSVLAPVQRTLAPPTVARALPLASVTPSSPPPRRARPVWTRWWFWTATVVGAAAAASAIGVGVTQAQSNEPSFVVRGR
jgi:hypothetical protein